VRTHANANERWGKMVFVAEQEGALKQRLDRTMTDYVACEN
jgi:hypothetical protein